MIYAVFAVLTFAVLILAIVRVLTRLAKSQGSLSKHTSRLATLMAGMLFSGLLMIAGLIVFSITSESNWYQGTFLTSEGLVIGGSLLLLTFINALFQIKTQREIMEMGDVLVTAASSSNHSSGKPESKEEAKSSKSAEKSIPLENGSKLSESYKVVVL